MSAEDYDNNLLLDQILQNDDYEKIFSNNCSPLNKQGFESDSIIENVSNYEKNYFDSFNRSFELMSLGSEQPCSPSTMNYQGFYQYGVKDRPSVSMSFDGQSFSTQDNSMRHRCDYHHRGIGMTYSPGIQKIQSYYMNGYQCERQPITDINDDIQLANDLDNMCGNQVLSRKVQKIFEHGKQDQKELIFSKVERSCVQFSKDVFGNYLMQKIFDKGSQNQQMRLFNKMRPHIYELSKNNFGCRVVQKIIDIICNNGELIQQFLDSIKGQVKSLLYDSNGNYVILKCLESLQKELISFMIQPVEDSAIFLMSSQYGCKIILKILDLYSQQQTLKIMHLCLQHQHNLCTQEFGNHILQFALKNNDYLPYVINFVLNHFEKLCLNKYASNTVEKMIEISNNELKQSIISILTTQSQINGLITFVNIATNPFGNYVIKKILIMSNQTQLIPLITALKKDPNIIVYIRSSEFGQRIYQLIEKLLLIK